MTQLETIGRRRSIPWLLAALVIPGFWCATSANAHCDTLDGPVVSAARGALESGDITPVLIWVRKADEPGIREAFREALAVRKDSERAKKLADTYFFETLVRVHRAAEGAPFTGLKPAGTDLGPAIPAADKALQTGNADELARLLTESVKAGLKENFSRAMAASKFSRKDVDAGRKYVEAYVTYVHYVERVHEAATRPPEAHCSEAHGKEEHAD